MEKRKEIIVIGKGIAGTLTALDLAHQYDVLLVLEGDRALPMEDEGLSRTLDSDYIENWWKKTLSTYRRLQVITNTKTLAIEPLTGDPGYQLSAETGGQLWQANGTIVINYSGQPIPGMEQHDQDFIDIEELKFSQNTTLDINQLARESLQIRKQGMELIEAIKTRLLPLPPSLTPDDLNRFIYTHLRAEILHAIQTNEYRTNREACIEHLTGVALAHLNNNRSSKVDLSATQQLGLSSMSTHLKLVGIKLPSLHMITSVSSENSTKLLQLFTELLAPDVKVECKRLPNLDSHFSFEAKGLTARQLLPIFLDRLCNTMDNPDTNYLKLYHHVLAIVNQPSSALQQSTNRFHQHHMDLSNLDLTATVSFLTLLAASPTQEEMTELRQSWLNKRIEPSTDWQKATEQYQINSAVIRPPAVG